MGTNAEAAIIRADLPGAVRTMISNGGVKEVESIGLSVRYRYSMRGSLDSEDVT